MEWQPIKTAPRDGDEVLGSGECDAIFSCVFVMYWCGERMEWRERSSDARIEVVNAWMPLPLPFDKSDETGENT